MFEVYLKFKKKFLSQSAKMYGAATLIFGKNVDNKIFAASWVHGAGFAFSEFNSPLTIIHKNELNYPRHLIANEEQLQIDGMSNYEAIPVGVPFIYTNPEKYINNVKRHDRLYFPSHSVKGTNEFDSMAIVLDEAKFYDCNAICLNAIDYDSLNAASYIDSKIKIIRGADSAEPHTLVHMRNIFLNAATVVTRVAGSHILYASICGCTIEVDADIGNLVGVLQSDIQKTLNQYPKKFAKDIEKYIRSHKNGNVLNKISRMTKNELYDFARHELGFYSKQKPEKIMSLLEPRNIYEKLEVITVGQAIKIFNSFRIC